MDRELLIQSAQFGVWGRRHCGLGQLTLLGTDPSSTPLIMPMRVHLDSIKRMMQSDFHISTGSRQRNVKKSDECNQFKVGSHGSDQAIVKFEEHFNCHRCGSCLGYAYCQERQSCRGDVIIEECRLRYPVAYDRHDPSTEPPKSTTWHASSRSQSRREAHQWTNEFRRRGPVGSVQAVPCLWVHDTSDVRGQSPAKRGDLG